MTASAVSIPLSLSGSGSLSNNTATTASGVATYSTLQVSAAGTNDQLTATLALNPAISSTSPAISITSSSFDVTATSAPSVTSANAAIFNAGSAGTFTVTTSGSPTPSLSESGALPSGVTFTDNGNGTATFSGTPAAGTSGVYSLSVTANNGISPNGTQSFTLTVDQGPAITSASSTTLTTGTSGSFTVTTTGNPKASLSESGLLPSGVTFINNGNGTATLSGTPAAGSGGSYPFTVTASNGVGSTATQNFTLTVDQAPAVTSANSTTFTTGAPGTFTVVASAYPTAALSESGALPSGVIFIDNGNGTATLAGTPVAGTANTYSLTLMASNGVSPSAAQSFTLTVVPPPTFVVTTTADDATGSASNCTSGGGPNCSLRDALAASVTIGGQISFSPAVFAAGNTAAENTITLTNETLNIPSNTTITGATSGSGATLKNLVTVNGNNTVQIFNVGSGVTGATVANLVITNAAASNYGGAIYNQGVLTVSGSTLDGNFVYGAGGISGGGIYNAGGTLNVIRCSITGNGYGEGIYNQSGTVNVSESTISGNSNGGGIQSASGTLIVTSSMIYGNTGDGIYSAGTLVVNNSIVAGNSYADIGGTFTGSGNVIGGTSVVSPLGNYGGPMQTMIPLPGSAAICAGLATNIPSGTTTDQRGEPNTNSSYTGYSVAAPCVDAGAVQTNYSIAFVQQPATVVQYATMSPAPTVQLDESGAAFTSSSVTIPLTLTTGSGTVTGGSASTLTTTDIATYSGLSISLPGSNDVLTASLTLNPALSTPLSISQASDAFNVNSAVTQLAFSTAPAATITAGGNAGAAVVVDEENAGGTTVTTASDTITLTVTGPNSYSRSYTQAAVSGAATFDLSGAALTVAGRYSFTASISTDPSITTATASENVSAGPAATVAVGSGSGQSAKIGAAFASLLEVKVEDANGNPVQGAKVTFTVPSSGASATISGSPATTASDGTASVTATANGTAPLPTRWRRA